ITVAQKLIPQFLFMSVGVSGAFLYLIRLACGPYVSWDRKNNPEPWNNLGPTYQEIGLHEQLNITKHYKQTNKQTTFSMHALSLNVRSCGFGTT
uniref:Uncharacterized protein n=1 Tax=Cyprinus carpio TaxID=7962 RepID=A0A8C2GUG8_CYPCA